MHTYATVFCSSGDVTCQPFPPVRGFDILSGVSHHKSYTVIVGGSMSPKASIGRKYWYVARSVGGRQIFRGHIHLQEETVKRVNTFK